jgi:AcrR family transcriptional regulator
MELTVSPAAGAHDPQASDPRIRRTRELLQRALATLLETREFDRISVQDITDAATVNRATFYAHYPDKFALLECLVAGQFHALLAERQVRFDAGCEGTLRALVLGVCDFLALAPRGEDGCRMQPHRESAVVAVVRGMLLAGFQRHGTSDGVSAELRAATASWAIYGAAREWAAMPQRPPSEEIAATVGALVAPLLH